MSDIKPIETCYDGYRFRSRLEARWAVFFNYFNEPYEYEKEGYKLPSGWYLPDFWLPKFECWLEVKGQKPTDHEVKLMQELAHMTSRPVIQTWSLPHPLCSIYCSQYRENSGGFSWFLCNWCEIQFRQGLALEHCEEDLTDFGISALQDNPCSPEESIWKPINKVMHYADAPKRWRNLYVPEGQHKAIIAAKSARFE